jgi:amino acid adenylation domain-containing protein
MIWAGQFRPNLDFFSVEGDSTHLMKRCATKSDKRGPVRQQIALGFTTTDGEINRGEKRPSSAERHKLLFEWNQTEAHYARNTCFHHLFEKQVLQSPGAIAVDFENTRLTYQELNLQANRVAHHLRSLGVGPDVLVGICVEPSLQMIVGLLGILKAGGAYVPLDPTYPKDRLAYMIGDAGGPVLLAQEKFIPILSTNLSRVVCLESIPLDTEQTNPQSNVAAGNLAYVIYTSGSTGRPKGAMISHRGLVNYLSWAVEAYQVAEGIGAPVHSSISFDLTITGLFTPLLTGRCVYMIRPDPGLSNLAEALRKNSNFSLVKITPAHLDLLQAQLSPNEIAGKARVFVIGGEALIGEKLNFWQEHAPETVLVNEYGPTETVVGCCVHFMPAGERITGQVTIGRPIANTRLYVLDEEMLPVPIGAKGELYIGGDSVARGYLNKPELSEHCFVPDPFANGSRGRLYKTGDVVRYRADGNLEFLGRMDDQVKIRGFRIELGEIESVLNAHPGLKSAAVVGYERSSGKFLVAYFSPQSGARIPQSELRKFLQAKLPHYMVPSTFVPVEKFPLTPNGKLDRRALPAPETVTTIDHVAPRSNDEQKLVQIWEQVFDRQHIGLHDDFFEMGGHSLMAARLIVEVNRTFGIQLKIGSLLQCTTVEAMAKAVQRERSVASDRSQLVKFVSGSDGPAFIFLNPPVGVAHLVRAMERSGSHFISDVPFSEEVIKAATGCNWESLPTVEQLAAPHVAAIKDESLSKPCIVAGFSYGGILAFETAHQLQTAGIPVDAVILFDTDIRWPHLQCFKHAPFQHVKNCLQFGARSVYLRLQRAIRWQRTRWLARRGSQDAAMRALTENELAWELFIRVWINALKRYKPRKLDARGFLLRAEVSVYREELDYDGHLGWSPFFARGIQTCHVPGDHESMWKEPNVQTLGRSCSSLLLEEKSESTANFNARSGVKQSLPIVMSQFGFSFFLLNF